MNNDMLATSLQFDGYEELVRQPLEHSDPASLASVIALLTSTSAPIKDAFNQIIYGLSGKNYRGQDARNHWRRILSHKQMLEARLGRRVGITVACLDYFELQERDAAAPAKKPCKLEASLKLSPDMDDSLMQLFSAGFHLKILKKELLRAKRYNHALSALLIDIDNFHTINETFSYKDGDDLLVFIAKIIQKIIRAVDVPACYSGDHFLVVLPDTNERETLDLAKRLKDSIHERTSRIAGLPSGVTVTIVTGQASNSSTSIELLHKLENKLEEGKRTKRNSVYTI
jgi:diguanylate cyclase (GGDEF)-like protein